MPRGSRGCVASICLPAGKPAGLSLDQLDRESWVRYVDGHAIVPDEEYELLEEKGLDLSAGYEADRFHASARQDSPSRRPARSSNSYRSTPAAVWENGRRLPRTDYPSNGCVAALGGRRAGHGYSLCPLTNKLVSFTNAFSGMPLRRLGDECQSTSGGWPRRPTRAE